MEKTTDDLTMALAEPTMVTVGGKPVAIRPLTIAQLPEAAALARQLFGDETLRFEDDDFILALEDRHIALMRGLLALLTDCPDGGRDLPVAGFMALFNRALELNGDFFLMVMKRALPANPPPVGSTSSSASAATATTGPSA